MDEGSPPSRRPAALAHLDFGGPIPSGTVDPQSPPAADYPPGLRLIFPLHALVAGLVGAQHLVFPRAVTAAAFAWAFARGTSTDEAAA